MDQSGTGQLTQLEPTGERFHSEFQGEIALEHKHRYLLAREYVAGMDVLDIASGEGYGSAMLAEVARRVVGVDLAHEAVLFSQQRYHRDNLEFMVGDCCDIPLPDACFDVVVSFETIEHHDRHQQMLAEIQRVLRPGGLLIISSPDKYTYSVLPNYKNPFHVKELFRHQFEQLLRSHFSNTLFAGQRVVFGSTIQYEGVAAQPLSFGKVPSGIQRAAGVLAPTFIVAMASNGPLPPVFSGTFDDDIRTSDAYRGAMDQVYLRDGRIAHMEAAVEARDTEIQRLTGVVEHFEAAIAERTAVIEERDSEIQRLTGIVEHFEAAIAERTAAVEARDSEIRGLTGIVEHFEAAIAERTAVIEERDSEIQRLTGIVEHEARISAALREQIETFQQVVATLNKKVSLLHHEQRQATLARHTVEGQLHTVLASSSWRITRPVRRVLGEMPRVRRWSRRGAKLVWWTLSFQLPSRLRAQLAVPAPMPQPQPAPRPASMPAAPSAGPGFDITAPGPVLLSRWLQAQPAPLRALLQPKGQPVPERLEPYHAWLAVNQFSDADFKALQAALSRCAGRLPKISIVTPIYNTPPELLHELAEAVRGQIYPNWEWCLADDGSPSDHVAPMLAELAAADARIKVSTLTVNGGISHATNAAVALATGDVIAFVDHDDLITPDCLAEMAICYADTPETDMAYSDDDKVDLAGQRFAPQFKPDWSPTLLLSFMYMSHILTVRRSLFEDLGGFRPIFDGSQDYDFALRAAERARVIGHVPKILYHWRVLPGSTAASGDAKPESFEAGRRAVAEALDRRGVADVSVTHPDWARTAACGMFEIRFPDVGPTVTIVIPTRNQLRLLRSCVESLKQTTYRNFQLLIADNESDDPKTLKYLTDVSARADVRVVRIGNPEGVFSYAALNNTAAAEVDTDFILFLNNDVEVRNPRWLSQMVGHARMPGVGAVGARLYFEDGTIQHAGIVHGYHDGLVGHAFRNKPPYDWGYMGFIRASREYSGVTAACMLTPREVFHKLGGFDGQNFAVAYNDVDYSYRLVEAGYRCVYCAEAELFHFEGKSRGFKDNPREIAAFRRKWGSWQDRWYNRNLSLENECFEPAAVRPGINGSVPIHVVMVSHNLNHEGAPIWLFDLAKGLLDAGGIRVTLISPVDGALRADWQSLGIDVHILDPNVLHFNSIAAADDSTLAVGSIFRDHQPDVVLANTLDSFWAIAGAARAGIPAVWSQHESEPWQTYYDYLPYAGRTQAYNAFAQAYRVLYVAEATRRGWKALETRGNFALVRYGIAAERLNAETGRWTQAQARVTLNVADGDIVVSIVGTVCQRKGQLDLVTAFTLLPSSIQRRLRVFIAGRCEPNYGAELARVLTTLPADIAARITITGGIPDPFLYYRAADIYVCASHIESAPRVLVEAMACGLPIITTPVFGIPELVKDDINALFYPAGDTHALAERLLRLVEDIPLRARLAASSLPTLDSLPGFDDMVRSYTRILRQASALRAEPSLRLEELVGP
jgi:GT2 family glycosyltransferase/SAM-dependent methyltransferase